jgi:hypothetical protein
MRKLLPLGALLLALGFAACGGGGGDDGVGDAPSANGGSPSFSTSGWATDFSKHSVSLGEFIAGGPPKDGIPSIDDPKFASVDAADEFLAPREPVAVVRLEGQVRGYPLQILTWHEIVNDEIAGEPVAVTYCPLCNSTVAFRREVGGEPVEFGTTGMLRNSDLVMYDRMTESWWQQITAEAVVGELTGTSLELVPSQILSWRALRRSHPDARVLSRDTGFSRDYGLNPYTGYDSNPDAQPFLLEGEPDRSLPPMERVAAIKTGDRSAVVYPFSRLGEEAPVNDGLEGSPIVVLFDPNVASALDAGLISEGRNVGAAAVFDRRLAERTLEFRRGPDPGTFRDAQTGSTWNISGVATSGSLAGSRLNQIPHDDQFWFALAAFFPDAEIRR